MQVALNIEGVLRAQKRFKAGIPKKTVRLVVLTLAESFATSVRINMDQKIYSRKVKWRRTGKLRQSVKVGPGTDVRRVFVGVDYAKHLEYGTKPHIIKPKRGRALAFNVGGKKVITRQVNHPGTKAYPFWRPAIKETKRNMKTIIRSIVNQELNKT